MNIAIETPALLFPAISMLLLAYSGRFLALSTLIRSLHASYETDHKEATLTQIKNLRRRIFLIRDMQTLAVSSMFSCVLAMLLIYNEYPRAGATTFGISLVLLLWSLTFSVREMYISTRALNIQLADLEQENRGLRRLTSLFVPRKEELDDMGL